MRVKNQFLLRKIQKLFVFLLVLYLPIFLINLRLERLIALDDGQEKKSYSIVSFSKTRNITVCYCFAIIHQNFPPEKPETSYSESLSTLTDLDRLFNITIFPQYIDIPPPSV